MSGASAPGIFVSVRAILQGIRIEYYCERTVVYKFDRHLSPEGSLLNYRHSFTAFLDNVLIERVGVIGLPRLYEGRAVSFLAVGIKRELGYKKKLAIDICE